MWLVLGAISAAVKSTSKPPFLQHSHAGMSPLLLPEHAAKLSLNPRSALPPHHPRTSCCQSLQQPRGHSILPWQGQVMSGCCCFLMSSFLLSSPWIMHMSYEQRAQGILGAVEKSSPPLAARIFQCILREKSFLLAISSVKLVYPPFPPYLINETALMDVS